MKLKVNKKYYILIAVVVMVVFLFSNSALAAYNPLVEPISWAVDTVISAALIPLNILIAALVSFFVWIFGITASAVIYIMQYNDFIGSTAVAVGWVVIRDLCNMFFILIMLVIAFATILRIESFGIKKLLKSVILAAILINFSKMISGLIIDFAQIFMLTFVSAFKDIGSSSFLTMFGIDGLTSLGPDSLKDSGVGDGVEEDSIGMWKITLSYLLALTYAIVATATMVVYFVVLVSRMVMIWVYVILSPLAYLAGVLPMKESISKQWWSGFIGNVLAGPVLAFFLWLSFVTMGTIEGSSAGIFDWLGIAGDAGNTAFGATMIGSADFFISFTIAIVMLVAGIMFAQQTKGLVGSVSKGVAGKMKKGGRAVGGWAKKKAMVPVNKAKDATKRGVKKSLVAGRGALRGVDQRFLGGNAGKAMHYINPKSFGRRRMESIHGWTGNKFRGVYNRTQLQAREDNKTYYDSKGVKYKPNEDRESKNYLEYLDKNGNNTKVDGKVLKDFKSEGQYKFASSMDSVKGRQNIRNEDEARISKEQEASEGVYKNSSGEELRGYVDVESNVDKKRDMYMNMAEKGAFKKDGKQLSEAMALFASGKDSSRADRFADNMNKKQASLMYDLGSDRNGKHNNEADYAAFIYKAKKGHVKITDQKASSLTKGSILAFKDVLSTKQFESQVARAHDTDERVGGKLASIVKDDYKNYFTDKAKIADTAIDEDINIRKADVNLKMENGDFTKEAGEDKIEELELEEAQRKKNARKHIKEEGYVEDAEISDIKRIGTALTGDIEEFYGQLDDKGNLVMQDKKDANGNIVYKKDINGNKIREKDADGNDVFIEKSKLDKDGKPILTRDEDGNSVLVTEKAPSFEVVQEVRINKEDLTQFAKIANAKSLGNIKMNNLSEEIKDSLASGINSGKLTSLSKSGDNEKLLRDLVSRILDKKVDNSDYKNIKKSNLLLGYVSNTDTEEDEGYIENKKKMEQRDAANVKETKARLKLHNENENNRATEQRRREEAGSARIKDKRKKDDRIEENAEWSAIEKEQEAREQAEADYVDAMNERREQDNQNIVVSQQNRYDIKYKNEIDINNKVDNDIKKIEANNSMTDKVKRQQIEATNALFKKAISEKRPDNIEDALEYLKNNKV